MASTGLLMLIKKEVTQDWEKKNLELVTLHFAPLRVRFWA